MSKSKNNKNPRFAFQLGLENLSVGDSKAARQALMKAIGIKSRSNLSRRASGVVNHTVPEYEGIEKTFIKYGVPKNKIWGFYEKPKKKKNEIIATAATN